jgi:hypothetical protein
MMQRRKVRRAAILESVVSEAVIVNDAYVEA